MMSDCADALAEEATNPNQSSKFSDLNPCNARHALLTPTHTVVDVAAVVVVGESLRGDERLC